WLAPMARRIPISRVRSMMVVYMARRTTRNEMTTAIPVRASLNCLRPVALSCITFETWATGVILWPGKRASRALASLSASREERRAVGSADGLLHVLQTRVEAPARARPRDPDHGEVAVDHGQLVPRVHVAGLRQHGVHHEVVGLGEVAPLHDVEAPGDPREGG